MTYRCCASQFSSPEAQVKEAAWWRLPTLLNSHIAEQPPTICGFQLLYQQGKGRLAGVAYHPAPCHPIASISGGPFPQEQPPYLMSKPPKPQPMSAKRTLGVSPCPDDDACSLPRKSGKCVDLRGGRVVCIRGLSPWRRVQATAAAAWLMPTSPCSQGWWGHRSSQSRSVGCCEPVTESTSCVAAWR